MGDERTRTLRRLVSRPRGLVKRRTQVKNEVSAVLQRNPRRRATSSGARGTLEDARHSVLELAKGKFTTDPAHHGGEGIFFSSRMFDEFVILSGEVIQTSPACLPAAKRQ